MPTLTGKVIASSGLPIRRSYPSGTEIGRLKYNDRVEASVVEEGWWKLSKITRGTTNIPLPGPVCWANGKSIAQVTTPPPPPPDTEPKIVIILATYDDGTEQVFEPQA
jgi:hypothetical protein